MEFAEEASTPKSDKESPEVMAFRKNDVLCHFLLLSGWGEGGAVCLRCLHLLRQGRRELGYGKRNSCDTGRQLLALETQ